MKIARYSALISSGATLALTSVAAAAGAIAWPWAVAPFALTALGLRDIFQTKHAVLRNYPILGHARYLLESVRPELRQYLVESDADALPFSRAQRSVVYQRAKGEPDSMAFGTKKDVSASGYEWVCHSIAPTRIASHDFRIVVGGTRAKPYSMSIFNISAMSFGALSANAIKALNLGARLGGFAHDTGEGSLSRHHREHGGDVIYEVGSGYFGCRNPDGTFSEEQFVRTATDPQVKMVEIKLSQGAKPGHGGVLPAAKVTPEISEARGVPMGVDCISPAAHSAFSTPRELLEFVERLRTLSGGKPTGFKLCIGQPAEFFGIAKAMLETGITPDFIVVDGSEGGTGAAPPEFADHVGAPLQEGLLLVHNTLVGIGLRDAVKIGASGKLVTGFDIARTLALGADWCNSARGFMFAVGCVQAQTCHTGRCPTGVATQDADRQRALVVPSKAQRVHSFHRSTMHALQELLQAAGLNHPGDLTPEHIVRRVSTYQVQTLAELLDYLEPGDLLQGNLRYPVFQKYWERASADSFGPPARKPTVVWLKPADAANEPVGASVANLQA